MFKDYKEGKGATKSHWEGLLFLYLASSGFASLKKIFEGQTSWSQKVVVGEHRWASLCVAR